MQEVLVVFLVWGNKHENIFIRVQMCVLPHCAYSVYIHKMSMDIRQKQIRKWREK